MNNQQYLDYCKQAFEKIFINDGDHVYIKDADFKYIMISPTLNNLFGDTQKFLGHNILEVAPKLNINTEVVNQLHTQDVKIKQSLLEQTCLEVMNYAQEPKIMLVHKTPIINPYTQDFIGIRGNIEKFIWPNLIKMLFKIQGVKGTLLNKLRPIDITEKYHLNTIQHIVLFLVTHNYSYSDISIIMNSLGFKISPARVSDHLEKLKLIFDVRTKNQLMEKAIGLNFHVILPKALFNKASSIEVTQQTAKITCL